VALELALSGRRVTRAAQSRGLNVHRSAIERSVSALVSGRHIVLLTQSLESAAGLAELLADVAADSGLCYGHLTVRGDTVGLLTPAHILAKQFENELWLVVRGADAKAIERVAEYIMTTRPPEGWRAILITGHELASLINTLPADDSHHFAWINVA
jgi:hypothetical protein